jgi:hypothetical protein
MAWHIGRICWSGDEFPSVMLFGFVSAQFAALDVVADTNREAWQSFGFVSATIVASFVVAHTTLISRMPSRL